VTLPSRKYVTGKMPGNPVVRRKFLWLILPTRVGATVPSSSREGRQEIVAFLKRKWAKELEYRLIKELWAGGDNRIAVRFAYEWHDDSGNSFRSYATRIGNSGKMA
jgi:hypothetical protein